MRIISLQSGSRNALIVRASIDDRNMLLGWLKRLNVAVVDTFYLEQLSGLESDFVRNFSFSDEFFRLANGSLAKIASQLDLEFSQIFPRDDVAAVLSTIGLQKFSALGVAIRSGEGADFRCSEIGLDGKKECVTITADDDEDAKIRCAFVAGDRGWLGGQASRGRCED
jgi:hypothetical protein